MLRGNMKHISLFSKVPANMIQLLDEAAVLVTVLFGVAGHLVQQGYRNFGQLPFNMGGHLLEARDLFVVPTMEDNGKARM